MRIRLTQIGIVLAALLAIIGCAEHDTEAAPTDTNATKLIVPPTIMPAPSNTLTPTPNDGLWETGPWEIPKTLSDTGPWMVYKPVDSPSLVIRDVIGDEVVKLQPPEDRNLIILANQVAPVGGMFAVLSVGSTQDPIELLVYDLPDLEIKFRTILVPTSAIESVEDTRNPDLALFALFVYTQSQELIKWSADGRQLAFISKARFPVEHVIVYDTQTYEQKIVFIADVRMQIVDWSPDGENLLVYAGAYIKPDWFVEFASTYLVRIANDEIIRLGFVTEDTRSIHPLGWLNDDQLVVIDYLWENSPTNLRLFNLEQGTETVLYSGRIGDATLDTDSGTLVFDKWNLAWLDEPNTEPKQMQVIYLPERRIRNLPISNYTNVIWHPSLDLFSAEGNDNLIMFDTTGRIFLELPNPFLGASKVFPSPNGQYVLIANKDIMNLLTLDGNVEQSFLELGTEQILWLPDSSGFYWLTEDYEGGDLYICTAAKDWQPQQIESGISPFTLMLINQ